jgi:hypothetical protein
MTRGYLRRVLLAVALIMASLVMTPTASADADDYFLNELHKTHQKWYWPYGESWIIGEAHTVCNDWAAGVGYAEEVEKVATGQRWTQRNSRFFIALATGTYCPEDTSRIPQEARLYGSGA